MTPFSRRAWFPLLGLRGARLGAQLHPDLVRKIGDHLLNDKAMEYIRVRAVCQPWFFPRNWLMLSPGYKLRTDGVVERLLNYIHHGNTEGLLILVDHVMDSVCLLNPLIIVFTDLHPSVPLAM